MFTRKESLLLLSALACTGAWSLGAHADTTAFELGAYTNGPGGKEVAAKDYVAAIASASSPNARIEPTSALVGATNLCVAYTVTGAFTAAREPCDRALTLARRFDDMPYRRFSRDGATSRALSNRGVLRALSGDAVGAARDLRAAAKSSDAWAAASRNLAYLETSPTYRVALADGAAAP